jgi:spore germination protein YaaH
VALFICCDTTADKWPSYVAEIAAHSANLTEVIFSPFEMSGNGTLITQGSDAEHSAAIAAATKLRGTPISLRTTGLVACSPAGIKHVIYDAAAAKDYIETSVDMLNTTGLQGFNLDAEFPNDGNSTDGPAFVAFMNQFADALHAANSDYTLSVVRSALPCSRQRCSRTAPWIIDAVPACLAAWLPANRTSMVTALRLLISTSGVQLTPPAASTTSSRWQREPH